MRSDFSPSGDGRLPTPSSSTGAGKVPHHVVQVSDESVRVLRDQRISFWNSSAAPYYFECSRSLSVAPGLIRWSPQLPSKVGAVFSHAGAFVSANLYLRALTELTNRPNCAYVEQQALLAARVITAAAYGSYIAKQGRSAQIREPLRAAQEALPYIDRRARHEVLLNAADALVALPVAATIDAHPGELLLSECLGEVEATENEELRAAGQVRVLRAYARMRCFGTACELARRWGTPDRQDLLPALGELVVSASKGNPHESAIAAACDHAQALIPSASFAHLLSWAELALSAGRVDLASPALTKALPMIATASAHDRVRARGMQLAVEALGGTTVQLEDESKVSPDEKVTSLACATQLVLALGRPAEATELVRRIEVESSLGAESPLRCTVESHSAIARLAAWALLRRANEKLVAELFSCVTETEGTEEAQLTEQYVISFWMRGMIESLSSPGSSRAAQCFFRGAGLRDQAVATGSMTRARSGELSRLGAQLASACGENEVVVSMFYVPSSGLYDSTGNGEARPASDTRHITVDHALLSAECGALGYHYARFLNSMGAEVLPAFLDFRHPELSGLQLQ